MAPNGSACADIDSNIAPAASIARFIAYVLA
ncbi:hypothetical protein ABIA44_004126 [Bradyrhizobium sp. USDA 329]